jgi:hypothetical protein
MNCTTNVLNVPSFNCLRCPNEPYIKTVSPILEHIYKLQKERRRDLVPPLDNIVYLHFRTGRCQESVEHRSFKKNIEI